MKKKKRKPMLYLVTTNDKYELPKFVGSKEEAANYIGRSRNYVTLYLYQHKKGAGYRESCNNYRLFEVEDVD